MYSLLLALIYIGFISLGLPDSLLGAGWPVMQQSFHVPISYMGIITMVISASTIVSSLLSDRLTRKLTTQVVTVASVFLSAIALFGISFATQFWMLIALSIPYGLGAGAIDAALNNYVALHYTSKHMSWLHCFWGVGTIFSPFVMSYALTTSTWNSGYRIVSLVQLGIGVVLLLTLPVWNANKKQDAGSDDESGESIGVFRALKIKGVPFLLLGFFAYCATESTAMGWASTYLVEVTNISEERAAAFASMFFIGLTFGRFVGGFLMDKLGDRNMIRLGTAILFAGIIGLILPIDHELLAIVSFVVIGLGCAPVYPCIIHATPSNFGADKSGAIIGIQMASAYLGTTFMPPLVGLIGRFAGFDVMPIFLLIFVAVMISMTEKTFRMTRK